jgi:hypothetical protein
MREDHPRFFVHRWRCSLAQMMSRLLWSGHVWVDHESTVHLLVVRWWRRPEYGHAYAHVSSTRDRRVHRVTEMGRLIDHPWLLHAHPAVELFRDYHHWMTQNEREDRVA